jgi:medium-chain acyl-[acyl-carrier-protein] hydrolase
VARALARGGGPEPAWLFVSGSQAPRRPGLRTRRHDLPDAEFREELRRLGGTPPELLANAELMAVMLPALRADFALCHEYVCEPGAPLRCPITAFAGIADAEVAAEECGAWGEATSGPFSLHVLPGDHFFVNAERRSVAELVAARLARAVRAVHP